MKERLTEAVMDLIRENSYGTTSLMPSANGQAQRRAAFYYCFESKSELAAVALEGDWKKRKADVDTIFSATVPPCRKA